MTAKPSLGHDVPPDPGALIESMRAFGYSLPTAVADLVDNSISAGATQIDVEFSWAGADSSLAVIDDGTGMGEATLTEAMRLGSRSPLERRAPGDLGRFGLGLKSAAWSQARSLTVLSREADGPVLARRWDLDHVTQTRRWELLTHGTALTETMARRLEALPHGTIVLLEHADRMVGAARADDHAAHERFLASVRHTADHLAMVFQRFMAGRRGLRIHVNGAAVVGWDPFLIDHEATQELQTERLANGRVAITPFVLPHVSRFTSDQEHRSAGGPRGWNAQQGFYVYRARRLLVAGSWLGLPRMQQEEHYKLARVRIDLDNDLDQEWQLDIRKATARIPGALQREMSRIATIARTKASDAYRFRGKTIARTSSGDHGVTFVWQRTARRGDVTFRVNREHPALAGLEALDAKAAVERALRLAEENLPIEAIVMEAREQAEQRPRLPFDGRGAEVMKILRDSHAAMLDAGAEPQLALTALAGIEPFDSHPEIVQSLMEELNSHDD